MKKLGRYFGVGFDKQKNKYTARILINGKTKYIGKFDNEIEAAIAYDSEVKKNGFDRRLNFPEPEPFNPIPNTKLIRLTYGQFAIVDLIDFERVNKFIWYAEKGYNTFYGSRVIRVNGKRGTQKLHRFILGITDKTIQIDHKDRNGLNNQRSNLRIATNQQNSINQIGCDKTSKYKGVYLNKSKRKYSAQIKVDYRSMHIGHFDSEIEAAMAYDRKAKELFGEFAYLNFK